MLFGAGICEETANIWYLLGLAVNMIRIIIPLVLIVIGMIDLGKAVVQSDEKAVSKAVGALTKRFIGALVMFFVPTIISALFSVLTTIKLTSGDANVCMQCLTNANGNSPIAQGKTCSQLAEILNAASTETGN